MYCNDTIRRLRFHAIFVILPKRQDPETSLLKKQAITYHPTCFNANDMPNNPAKKPYPGFFPLPDPQIPLPGG
ncbi:MAG: hypothetical protein DWI24_05780 [Planctomycetota bacterium]|nr:MAG: hypothetical protein DWI24_05780 [Planctomycetota bacterium]